MTWGIDIKLDRVKRRVDLSSDRILRKKLVEEKSVFQHALFLLYSCFFAIGYCPIADCLASSSRRRKRLIVRDYKRSEVYEGQKETDD